MRSFRCVLQENPYITAAAADVVPISGAQPTSPQEVNKKKTVKPRKQWRASLSQNRKEVCSDVNRSMPRTPVFIPSCPFKPVLGVFFLYFRYLFWCAV